jgi:hypothetical protein
MIIGSAYLPDGRRGPGRLSEVPLELVDVGPAELTLPEATVRDERGGDLLGGGLAHDPSGGGGPFADPRQDREARAFGLVNTAFHTQRALRWAGELLGRRLPRLVIRVGVHEDLRRWSGGHYRVAAADYDPPEPAPVAETGEVHLGGGGGVLRGPDGQPYFAAPAHNLALIYHEIGHHICRHTADFRLNRLRPPDRQTNKKVAVDEGTCDLVTAILLDSPDIYGWHRGALPEWDRRRRLLHTRWTMAHFRGGRADPHADGTIWASACWSARERVVEAGHPPARFDRMLLRGLAESVDELEPPQLTEDALRRRRHYASLLAAMLRTDPELTDPVLAGMAGHGITPGATNAVLREAARAGRLVAVGE